MGNLTLFYEIKRNAVNYFLIFFVLVIAIVSGFVVANNINSKTDNSISEYLFSAFESLKYMDTDINSETILFNIFLQNIVVFGIIALLGIIRFGFIFVYPIIFFKGVVSGFTCNIIFEAFNFINTIKVMFIFLPSFLIVVLLLIRCACKSIKYSLSKSILKTSSIINYNNDFISAWSYYTDQFKCIVPLIIACLWDSYVVVWILT